MASLAELASENVQINLRLGDPDEALVEGLKDFGSDVRLDQSEGLIHMSLPDDSKIPELLSWLVDQGQDVYELSPQRLSLEERFLQIVGDEMLDA